MRTNTVLLLTDLVDSTRVTKELGDAAAAALWEIHDRIARDLLRQWRGREIDKSDGFLLLFDRVEDAIGYAHTYHAALRMQKPPLQARAGLHCGPVVTRQNSVDDIAWGAKAVEVEGIAKATAARIMSLAQGGQTLMSAEALAALAEAQAPAPAQAEADRWRTHSHGHWRLKGIADPMELFEVGGPDAPFTPPPDSAKAYRVIRASSDWQPARELPHNLPAERDGFVGRHEALLDLAQRFDDGARLVSLLGIGGIGKTRLALRYARTWLGDYAGGAWFCDLSQARSQDGIVHAVAQALEVPLGKADPVQQLGAAIAGRGPCLVILDNYEQVARHAEATLGVWLERAPQARFIATSREVLGIAGEQAQVLAPLGVDEAVSLFQQRMAAAGIGYVASAGDGSTVKALVDLLDRLPLAIELAAARVRVMPVAELLRRMGERFKLLTSSGGRHDRQATLRATLDWSWDLLSPIEQSALAQLSVFEGGFTLEAAEAVVAVEVTAGGPITWVADLVQSLIEKSLVRSVPPRRFDMLRSVHEYAAERLRSIADTKSSLDQAQQRHFAYFASMDEDMAVADRCADTDNLVLACRRATGHDVRLAVRALELVWSVLRLVGPFSAIEGLIEAVNKVGPLAAEHQISNHWVTAGALHKAGDLQSALGQALAGLKLAEEQARDTDITRMLLTVADILRTLGRSPESADYARRALHSAQTHQDNLAQLKALNCLGALHYGESHFGLAEVSYHRALVIAQKLNQKRWQGGLLGNLGALSYSQGHWDKALHFYKDALEQAKFVGDRQWEGNNRSNLGMLIHETGDDPAAIAELDIALKIARSIGHNQLERVVLCNLGIVLESLGDRAQAERSYEEAIALCERHLDSHAEAEFRGYLGLLLARVGANVRSMAQMATANAKLREIGSVSSLALLKSQHALAAALSGDLPTASSCLNDSRALIGLHSLAPSRDWLRVMREIESLMNA